MTGALHPSLHRLRDALRTYARTEAPDIQAFCGAALAEDHLEQPLPPHSWPVIDRLALMAEQACPATEPVVRAVIAAAPHLHWRHSYTQDDPGIDASYLASSGWFNLIAPSGPFVSRSLRLSVGYWGEGLHYPHHHHGPEEIYLTLAGSAVYLSEGRAPLRGGPGATVAHHARQWHAATMDQAPLLAAAFWRGDGLEVKSVLRDAP
ncbi:MAG: dimethylsulfonioproprionate lyase family protein [Pseudomonadota bacterium]